MSFAARQRALRARGVRHFGDNGTVTLRRRHTLKSQRKGTPAVSGVLLLVNDAALAGAVAIGLRADLLTGRLPKGCRFTIAGNATIYTTGADAEASGGALAGVTISPALAANAADGAVVTLSTPYVDYTLTVQRGEAPVDNLDTGERQTGRALHVAYTADVTPEPGDLVIVDAEAQPIAEVRPVDPGGGVAGWDLVLGGRG